MIPDRTLFKTRPEKEKRLVRIMPIAKVSNNRKVTLDQEIAIAEDYHFTDKPKQDIAKYHNIPYGQVFNISKKYIVKETLKVAQKIEIEISEDDAEFVQFLLTEYRVDYKLNNLLIESSLNPIRN